MFPAQLSAHSDNQESTLSTLSETPPAPVTSRHGRAAGVPPPLPASSYYLGHSHYSRPQDSQGGAAFYGPPPFSGSPYDLGRSPYSRQPDEGFLTELKDGTEEDGLIGILNFCWMMMVREGLGVVVFTGFAIMVCCLNEYAALSAYMDVELVAVLGTVVSLVLGFKITDSSSRWWEARSVWSALHAATRSLVQLVWLHLAPQETAEGQAVHRDSEEFLQYASDPVSERGKQIKMLQALGVAVKLAIRPDTRRAKSVRRELLQFLGQQGLCFKDQTSSYYDTLPLEVTPLSKEPWLSRIRDSSAAGLTRPQSPESGMELSRWIVVRLTVDFNRFLSQGRFKAELFDTIQGRLCDLETAVADMTRLATYPIPASYARQLRLAVWSFLALLPFQMYRSLRWFTIPVQCLAAIIYLGFLEIGVTPSDPFKEGYSGMNIKELVELLQKEEQGQTEIELDRLARPMTGPPPLAGAARRAAAALRRQKHRRRLGKARR